MSIVSKVKVSVAEYHVLDEFTLADEDGVFLYETMFQLVGAIAQECDALINPHTIDILVPKLTSPLSHSSSPSFTASSSSSSSSDPEPLERERQHRKVRTDDQLMQYLRKWSERSQVNMRKALRRRYALKEIQRVLLSGGKGSNALEELAEEPIKSLEDKDAERLAGMQSLRELAYNAENHQAILEHEGLIKVMIDMYNRDSDFDGEHSVAASAALWSLSCNAETRKVLRSMECIESILRMLERTGTLSKPFAPVSHEFSLVTLLGLLSDCETDRLRQLLTVEYVGFDVIQYFATLSNSCTSGEVFHHTLSILGVLLTGNDHSMRYFMHEYQGNASKVMDSLILNLHNQNQRYLDSGNRFLLSTLVAQFALFSKQSRELLIERNTERLCTLLLRMIRGVLYEASNDPRPSASETSEENISEVPSCKQEDPRGEGDADPTILKTFDLTFEMVTLLVRESQQFSTVDLDAVLSQADVTKRKGDNLFDGNEWGMSRDRAHELTLLNTTAALYEVTLAIIQTEQELPTVLLSTLLTLVLVSRQEIDPRPAVEQCALAALSLLAQARPPKYALALLSPSLLTAQRVKQHNIVYAKLLADICLGTGQVTLAALQRVNVSLYPSSSRINRAYGFALLCGLLNACLIDGLSAGPFLKALDLSYLLDTAGSLPQVTAGNAEAVQRPEEGNEASSQSRHMLRCFSAACLMFHACLEVPYTQEEKEQKAKWTSDCLKKLLSVLEGKLKIAAEKKSIREATQRKEGVDIEEVEVESQSMEMELEQAPPPVGMALTFLSLCVWGLGKHEETRELMKRLAFVQEGCMALNRSMEYLEIYCSVANQGISNVNKLSQIKSRRITAVMQSSEGFGENREVIDASKEHLESMVATINALFALCEDGTIAEQLLSVSVRRENGALVDAFTLFEIALHCINRTNVIWTQNAKARDTIAARLLSFLHMLAANDTFYSHFTSPTLLRLLSRTAYNESFSARVRTCVAELFLFLDTYRPAAEVKEGSKGNRGSYAEEEKKIDRVEAICNELGETYVPELVINFLKSNIEEVNKSGADMLFRLRETELGKELIRNKGGCKLLLNLAKQSTSFELVESTLKGLLHMSRDDVGQVHLCSIGLYDVLYLCWTVSHDIHRYYCALLMQNLTSNPRNKTALYKAELRARKMLGWKHMKDPSNSSPNLQKHPRPPGSMHRPPHAKTSRTLTDRTALSVGTDTDRMHASPKEKFLKWFDDVFVSSDVDNGEQQRQAQVGPARTSLSSTPNDARTGQLCFETVEKKFNDGWAAAQDMEEAFHVRDPAHNPLWPFRQLITDDSYNISHPSSTSGPLSMCLSYDLSQPYSHSAHSAFSEQQFRQANACLQMRLRQPARALWCSQRLTYQGAERWKVDLQIAEKVPSKPKGSKPASVRRVTQGGQERGEEELEVWVSGHHSKRKYTFRSKYSVAESGSESPLSLANTTAGTEQMFLFRHVAGSQIYDNIPSHSLPNGQAVYVYYNGQKPQGTTAKPSQLYVPKPPQQVSELGLPNCSGLPSVPAINTREGWVKLLLGSVFLPRFVSVPPVSETHSLEAHGNRQYNTNVSWTRRGSIDDEKLPLDIVDREANAGDSDDSDVESEAEWCLENSVFSSRARTEENNNQFREAEEGTLAERAFEADWQLCDQKRTFRKLLAKSPTTVGELKQVIRERYHFLCGIFRFYSAQDPAANVFTMQMTEFSQFLEDTWIKENSKHSLLNEGNCGTLFIQVAFNSIDRLNEDQMEFAEECRILSLSKNHSLMRYQFLEVIIRLAHAKYFVSGIAPSFLVAVQFLLDHNILKYLRHEIGVQPDKFREDRLYCTQMDNVLHCHLLFLKSLYKMYAGCGADSYKWGGAKRLRMTSSEWATLLSDAGIISAIFTQREASVVFRTSSEETVDNIKNWRAAVTLNFTSFLEAIARVAETAFIPSQEQLENVGADDIVQFYHIMQATGLWTTIADTEEKNTDPLVDLAVWGVTKAKTPDEYIARSTLKYDERPLAWKLEQLVQLLKHMKEAADAKKYRRKGRVSSKVAQGAKKEKEKTKEKEGESDDIRGDHALTLEITKSVKDKLSLKNFETHVASSLHDMWRKSRGQEENGKYVPRVKVIKGVTYDIANLHFKDLPGHFAMENLLAAHVACESIRSAHRMYQEDPSSVLLTEDGADAAGGSTHPLHKYLRSSKFLAWAGEQQHVQWLKRNGMKDWVEDHQRVTYVELTESDRKKCEQIAVIAAEFWIANDTDK